MLVLSRRVSETLMLGENVKVTVLGISGNQVRLGITAPDSVGVHREEVYVQLNSDSNQGKPGPGH